MTAPIDINSRIENIEKQLNAKDDENDKLKEKNARIAAMTASIKLAMDNMTPEERNKMKEAVTAGKDEEMKTAMNSIPNESYYNGPTPDESTNNSSIAGDGKTLKAMEDKNKELQASVAKLTEQVTAMQKTAKDEFIEALTEHKEMIVKGLDKAAYKGRLEKVPFEGIKALYSEREDEMKSLKEKAVTASVQGYEFPNSGYTPPAALVSLSEALKVA